MQYKIIFNKEMRPANYKLSFSGVQQNEESQNYINDVVTSLTPRVPAKSFVALNIAEIENQVTATFKSVSASVKFESTQKADSTIAAMDLISKDVNQQIEGWLGKMVV